MDIFYPFPVLQVVGYKNAGKTTFMGKLIRHFSSTGLQVGTLKHHGHDSPLKAAKGTDSYKHSEAGSKVAAVKGTNELQITVKTSGMETLAQLIHLYTYFHIDLLLIEGFKNANYPKIVLLKDEREIHLLTELTNIKSVGVQDPQLIGRLDHFTFSLAETDQQIEKVANMIKMRGK